MPYLAHFALEDHPFTLTPDVDYFFPTQEHANIIGSVEFALRRDTGIIKVVGDVGTGKTLLCRLLIKKLVDTEAVAYINAPRANAQFDRARRLQEFGLDVGNDADAAYQRLNSSWSRSTRRTGSRCWSSTKRSISAAKDSSSCG